MRKLEVYICYFQGVEVIFQGFFSDGVIEVNVYLIVVYLIIFFCYVVFGLRDWILLVKNRVEYFNGE